METIVASPDDDLADLSASPGAATTSASGRRPVTTVRRGVRPPHRRRRGRAWTSASRPDEFKLERGPPARS